MPAHPSRLVGAGTDTGLGHHLASLERYKYPGMKLLGQQHKIESTWWCAENCSVRGQRLTAEYRVSSQRKQNPLVSRAVLRI